MSRVSKITIGVPTFGNFHFTKMALEHIKKTVGVSYNLFVVVGKPQDRDTPKYCADNDIPFTKHLTNKGLPASVNDIYDVAFRGTGKSDAVIVVGNDVLPYWKSIDTLVDVANSTDYEWVSGVPVSINRLLSKLPKCRKYFGGGEKNKNFNGKALDEWLNEFVPDPSPRRVVDLKRYSIVGDSHNMCLFTRSVFERVGYVDVNYHPAYFEDNDLSRRSQLLGIKMCRVSDAIYFHFWSRTIHQGGMKAVNDKYFPLNRDYYMQKWGDVPGKEKFKVPFNGGDYCLGKLRSKGHLCISSRKNEDTIIYEWQRK